MIFLLQLLSFKLEDVPKATASSSDEDVLQQHQQQQQQTQQPKLGATSTPILPPIGTPPPADFNADQRRLDPDERPLPTVSKQVRKRFLSAGFL